jgi:hypothetical protein
MVTVQCYVAMTTFRHSVTVPLSQMDIHHPTNNWQVIWSPLFMYNYEKHYNKHWTPVS